MTVAEASATQSPAAPSSFRGRAFGIEIGATVSLPLSQGPVRDGRALTVLRPVPARELDDAWRPSAATTVLERRFADGRLVMTVEHDHDAGYRVYTPRDGRHLVSTDGHVILSFLPKAAPWRWQRLLLAQVLPLAATLQGLELLHASAVERGGKLLGFVAPAGTGKTSVAAHSVALGASLFTDDVLALERYDDGVLAHPGANALHVDGQELDAMPSPGRDRLGPAVGGVDKVVLASPVSARPRRLDFLYFMERPASGELSISRLEPEPVQLLANSFNGYVRTPARIVNQLGVLERLAESVAMFAVAIPTSCSARDVAVTVAAHAELAS